MNKHAKIAKPRQLNLKDDETYELAATLAARHGDTLNDAVKGALRDKLEREKREETKAERLTRLKAIIRRYSDRVGKRTMSDEDAIGYDENGLPR